MTATRKAGAHSVPSIVYGTAWKEAATGELVRAAFDAGYRGFDTANQRKHYVEEGVGHALASLIEGGACTRENLFVQSKYTYVRGQDHRLPYDPRAPVKVQVEQSFRSSLEHLRTDYLDSLVLHGPMYAEGLAAEDCEAWAAMESVAETGGVRTLGISNISASQLKLLLAEARTPPTFVQNRCFARRGWDADVRAICDENGIVYQGFSLLTANPGVLESPRTREIALRCACTPAQVVFAFSIAIGILPLTGTTDRAHMQQDLEATRIRLERDEINALLAMQ